MNRFAPLASLLALIAVTGSGGCGGSAATTPDDVRAVSGTTVAGPVTIGGAPEGTGDAVDAPATANLTIYCRDFTGADHFDAAERTKIEAEAAMQQERGSKGDFYLLHGERRSVLYHGFYSTFDPNVDRREATRANRDQKLIEQMSITGPGGLAVKAFPRSMFTPLERPDPAAPAEWDLRNADGYWTVCIGGFTDDPRHKQAAVEAVAEARKSGIEAYYFHEGTFSYVCIGTWPENAIRKGTSTERAIENMDPNNPRPLIISTTHLPEHFLKMRDSQGRPPIILQQRVQIDDPTLDKVMRSYNYDINGENRNEVPLLFRIPVVTGKTQQLEAAPINRGPDSTEMRKLLERPF